MEERAMTPTHSRRLALAPLAALLCLTAASGAPAATLDRIKQDKAIRIAYREDAPPFSEKNSLGEPAGFMIDLCRSVAKKLTQELKIPSLSVVYVPVTSVNRFDAIKTGKADLLCEPSTETLTRRAIVDFSIPTFVDGASLMIRTDGPQDLQSMAGKKIGVLAGTTTEEALHNTLKDNNITADVIEAKTHSEGVAMLDDQKIDAYFGDRSILAFLIKESKAPDKLMLADDFLTVEPYALALPHGDEAFRLAVDRALSHIYRSGEIDTIFQATFAGQAKPSKIL
jgi:ABC-type amino acid transport substrate-binding protein